jgi:hypothetical protein
MVEVPRRGHGPFWREAMRRKARGEPVDWDAAFAGYRATVDFPAANFWAELAEAYPKAKVVLTVRDPQRWYDSASKAFGSVPTIDPSSAGGYLVSSAYVSGRSYDRSRAVSENRVRGKRVRDALKSASVGLLLLSVVASAIAGAETAFFSTVLASWLLFPVLVGFRNTLDAGCVFMLISIGVMMAVGLAQHGPGYLLP